MPLSVKARDEQAQHEERPERHDQRGGDLVEQLTVGSEARPQQRRANTEQDEDHRKARHEQQARDQHPALAGALKLSRSDADDRR
jgi:hypothetical protein